MCKCFFSLNLMERVPIKKAYVRRRIYGVLLWLFSLSIGWFLPAQADAKVSGLCSDCHTMHYSQGGMAPSGWGQNGPHRFLTVSDCVGCHSNTQDSRTIVDGTPIVFNSSPPVNPLAGGNFYWVVNNGDNFGHNVLSIPGVGKDEGNRGPPGGFYCTDPGSCGFCHGGDGGESWLCDCTSCHVPRHHAEDHPGGDYNNVVDESGGFYRFLGRQKYNYALPSNVLNNIKNFHNNAGVKGVEDPDWEQTRSPTDHNEYPGETDHAGSLVGGYDSISDWCRGCHGDFHYLTNQVSGGPYNVGSPRLRHPIDYAIPKKGEYAGAYGSDHTYDPLVPVARPDIDSFNGTGPSDVVRLGTDQVQCLSCHRAHGSPYPDMLRWDYRKWPAGGTNGCAVCHTSKQ